jgi:hypothetical protein
MKTTPLRTLLHRPWAVWLAVLIAVLGAIAPTVSHALVLARGTASAGMEVCTNQGPRWIVATDTQTADSDSAPQPGSIFSLAHCPFCLQPTDRVALINDPLPHPFLVQDGQRKPSVWQVFFYATKHTVNPPPRGPPGFF